MHPYEEPTKVSSRPVIASNLLFFCRFVFFIVLKYFHNKYILVKYCLLVISYCLCTILVSAQQKKVLLPNGWSLAPAGRMVQLGDLPLNMAISNDGKYIAVTNNGVSKQTIQLIDAKTHVVICTKEIAKSWFGLKFSQGSKYLYASGGNDNRILK